MIVSNLDLLIPGNDTDLPGAKLRTKWAVVKETGPLALSFDYVSDADTVVVDGMAAADSGGVQGAADPELAAISSGLVFPSWSLVDTSTLHSGQLVWVIIDGREVGIIGVQGGVTQTPIIHGYVSNSSLAYGQWIEPQTMFPPYLIRGGFTTDGNKAVIPVSGFYRVTSNVNYRDGMGALPRGASYFVNGKKDTVPEMMRYDGWNGWELHFDGPNWLWYFTAGDKVSLACYTANSGGGTVYDSWFSIQFVST